MTGGDGVYDKGRPGHRVAAGKYARQVGGQRLWINRREAAANRLHLAL